MSSKGEITSNSSESSLSSVEEGFGSDDEDISITYGAVEPYFFEPEFDIGRGRGGALRRTFGRGGSWR